MTKTNAKSMGSFSVESTLVSSKGKAVKKNA